jgi:hypothetical protein
LLWRRKVSGREDPEGSMDIQSGAYQGRATNKGNYYNGQWSGVCVCKHDAAKSNVAQEFPVLIL